MPEHFLKRNTENEPICACGYRPETLDDDRPWINGQLKAKTAVLDHVQAMGNKRATGDEMIRFTEDVIGVELQPWQKAILMRPADAPFRVKEQTKFPRAGVRQTIDGKWLLTCWDGDTIVHVMDEPNFTDRVEAFDYAHMTIGACRVMRTNLNGLEVP